MAVLSISHRRAANAAMLCRRISSGVRRPALLESDGLAISVGVGESATIYLANGNIYEAQFSVDPENNISWSRNDLKPAELQAMADRFFRLAFRARNRLGVPFFHWCSISCGREHNR